MEVVGEDDHGEGGEQSPREPQLQGFYAERASQHRHSLGVGVLKVININYASHETWWDWLWQRVQSRGEFIPHVKHLKLVPLCSQGDFGGREAEIWDWRAGKTIN